LAQASDRLSISPPAASRLITLLEANLGITLFSRDKRRLELTAEGEAFYRQVLHTLDGIEELKSVAMDIQRRSSDSLTIVTATPVATGLVSPTLEWLGKQGRQVRCFVNLESRFAIESKVAARSFNLGLISLPVENAIIDLAVEPLLRTRLGVLLPAGHALATYQSINVQQLKDLSFITLFPRQRWRDRLDELFTAMGAMPQINVEVSSTSLVVDMVKHGIGATIIDRVCAGLDISEHVVFRPIDPPVWITYAGLFATGTNHLPAREFLRSIRSTLQEYVSTHPHTTNDIEIIQSKD
jgi:DNA-binding transcriptional LysR family regulator